MARLAHTFRPEAGKKMDAARDVDLKYVTETLVIYELYDKMVSLSNPAAYPRASHPSSDPSIKKMLAFAETSTAFKVGILLQNI